MEKTVKAAQKEQREEDDGRAVGEQVCPLTSYLWLKAVM